MNSPIQYHYRYTISNAVGDQDNHLSGRVIATNIKDAFAQAIAIWPFPYPPMEISLEYCGLVRVENKTPPVPVLFGER